MYMRTCWAIVLFFLGVSLLHGCASMGMDMGGGDTSGSGTSGTSGSSSSPSTTSGSSPTGATGSDAGGMSGSGGSGAGDPKTGATASSGSSSSAGEWGNSAGAGTAQSTPSPSAGGDRGTPSFPWPAPRASATTTIPLRTAVENWRNQRYFPPRPANTPVFLSPDKLAAFFSSNPPQLTHADHALRYILSSAGYVETSYHPIPDGFAMVTRLEQIEADGRPKEPGRWDIDAPTSGPFSIAGYLRALFTAPPGHFRILVFAVTSGLVVQSQASVSSKDATEWLSTGSSVLPESIGNREFSWNHHCTVLIYEFERGSPKSKVALRYPGLPATSHLAGAGLNKLLP